ncbi:Filamentation induced by cAMP protein Fic [Bradyrhizobium sp. ORS 285]|uniref:Fic family protein n=1 Tax=Bradyrhizobium sp. ORS 285 TaxID=115808 RepID=UPI00024078CD|nr:Fic family protein [Bradyrhizobium sp. ORS 285]CCD86736.1 Filamentation induced by cAMP protein Fic [Bradyrhizobium sp. ORS 285]SMX61744.1 Filamentation induced by cAMP protein Fic [Bradyrhizobium sp. ORS 285]
MVEDRHSVAEAAPLLNDPDEIARREAENGLRQFDLALEMIRSFVKDKERVYRLRSSQILQLHTAALAGIHPLAGTWRNTPVTIQGSRHQPPEAAFVSEEIEHLCDYVNDNWATASALHLAAYVLWKLNWIHPFADGNGRTARAVSYVVMSIKLDSLLPGAPTIPEQIAGNKRPYYDALEAADAQLNAGAPDVSALETMLEAMLAQQLVSAAKQATGEVPAPTSRNWH